jgi:hypothetical protein
MANHSPHNQVETSFDDADDIAAFTQEMADVVPIKHNDKVAIKSNDVLDLACPSGKHH